MNNSTNTNPNAFYTIIIEGHKFTSDAEGRWDLTNIWKTLGLPKSKQPNRWRTASAKRLSDRQKMEVVKIGLESTTYADKQATLKYAAWVSEDFEDMVYAAFETKLKIITLELT
ncbi:hypothetical protein [Lonsdalea populi]|uniref:hypothetical protein n=1 Tax=Lonsdalea populi TaxID=1172565 RepID=UPI000F45E93F|nr:hypothetical protein [Lonsdalea populi]ROH79758.1 hypothetical protein EC393_06445 [Lonsdalea populi]